jgi:GntR family transcriptional repressor for pyruvate dehydrogenase complex
MTLATIQKNEKVIDLVLARIKNSLIRGDLKPGDKLPGVNELSSKLGVGISSVREALKMLEGWGAVESRHGTGTFVCDSFKESTANVLQIQLMLLPKTAEYIVQFWEMYERAYTYLAMENMNDDDLAAIEAAVIELEDKINRTSPNVPTSVQDEIDFHRRVLYGTHNPYVIKIGEVIQDLFFDILQDSFAPLPSIEAAKDHRKMLEALRNEDIDVLEQVFEKCFHGWRARFKSEGEKV